MPKEYKTDRARALADSRSREHPTPVAFYSSSVNDAMAVLRMLGPAKHAKAKVIRGAKEIEKVQGNPIMDGNPIVIQRDFSRDYDRFSKLMGMAHSLQKPVVLDLDDLLLALPENHPDRLSGYFAEALLPLLQSIIEVDLLTVASEKLRDQLLPYNPNIKVIPNYLDDSLWNIRKWETYRNHEDIVTIGYMGGHSHEPDLKMVLPALLRIVEKYPGKIKFRFWGIEVPTELEQYSTVEWCPRPSQSYTDFAEFFQKQTADIVIAPLCDNLFNSCKSSIKFLEYGAVGVPGVYSRLAPYLQIVEDGKDGLLAGTVDEWVATLSRLIESPGLGNELIVNAQKKINDNWLLSQHARAQFDYYAELVFEHKSQKKSAPFFLPLVKAIAAQSDEKKKSNDILIKALGDHTMEMNQTQLPVIERSKDLDNQVLDSTIKIGALIHEIDDLQEKLSSVKTESTKKTARIVYLEYKLKLLRADKRGYLKELEISDNRIKELQNETVMYATSRSWRWTRPFRKILSKIHRKRDNG